LRTYNLDAVAFGSYSAWSIGAVYANTYNDLEQGFQFTINQSAFVGTNRMSGDGGSINSQTFRAQGLWAASAGGSVTRYSNFHSVGWNIGANAAPKIGTAYGIYLEGLNASYATLAYGVYQAGANDKNYFAGNVGIGTASPGYELDVSGTANINPSALPALYVGRVSGQPNIKGSTTGYLIMDSDTNFAAINYYVNQNVILAFGGGRVGIGTSSPSFNLSFGNGANRIISIETSGSATAGRNLKVEAGNSGAGTNLNGGTLEVEAGLGTGTGTSNITFLTGGLQASGTTAHSGPTERMRITNLGRVGIGTTSPTTDLHVAGTGYFSKTTYIGTSSYANTALYVDNNQSAGYTAYFDNNNSSGYGINVNRYSFIQRLGIGSDDGAGNPALDVGGETVTTSVYADGDGGGRSGTTGITNATNLNANSTGVLTIKSKGTTNRDSSGFIKIYIGTTTYYIPVFTTITG